MARRTASVPTPALGVSSDGGVAGRAGKVTSAPSTDPGRYGTWLQTLLIARTASVPSSHLGTRRGSRRKDEEAGGGRGE